MTRLFLALFAALFLLPAIVGAQSADEVVWIQIEAQPNLSSATERARAYSDSLEDVNGFALGGGWYGIAVGPYLRRDAELLLRSYRREGLVPRDSFIQVSQKFRQQFWPVGANVLNIPTIEPIDPNADTQTPVLPAAPVDETLDEARRSERDLDRGQREQLQIALEWAGFYNSAIDGAFGRGTRGSMAQWQEANGYEVTGVLMPFSKVSG